MTEQRQVICATGLWKGYTSEGGDAASALQGADLDLFAGEVVAVTGRSGSGKTTLLNLLAGLDRPDRGSVSVEGQDLQRIGEAGRTALRRRRIGFVFQFFNLLPTLTALENVVLALELAGRGGRAEAARALGKVGLEKMGGRYPHELSGGEQQRVAIARALAKDPAVVLADEPTGNLDSATGEAVMSMLSERCRAAQTSLLLATHAGSTARWADRVLLMADGRLEPHPNA